MRIAVRSPVSGVRGWLMASLLVGALTACDDRVSAEVEALPEGTGVGERAPPVRGASADGESFAIEGRPASPTVLVFYRSADCGLCRVQLEQTQQHMPAYRRQGSRVVAVTLDPPEVSRGLAERMELDFEIVSVNEAAFEAWGALDAAGAPLPATYILDRDGVVRFRHIGRNASDRTSDAELLTLLEQINAS